MHIEESYRIEGLFDCTIAKTKVSFHKGDLIKTVLQNFLMVFSSGIVTKFSYGFQPSAFYKNTGYAIHVLSSKKEVPMKSFKSKIRTFLNKNTGCTHCSSLEIR